LYITTAPELLHNLGEWLGRKDSNLQHTESESVVLPIELLPSDARALRAVTPLAMITCPAGVAAPIAWKKYGDT